MGAGRWWLFAILAAVALIGIPTIIYTVLGGMRELLPSRWRMGAFHHSRVIVRLSPVAFDTSASPSAMKRSP